MKIKYDISLMKFMSLFENLTHASLKDCFIDEKTNTLVFVVQPGQIGKALGKKAANVKKLENKLQRKIRIIEYHPDKLEFIRNMIMPLRAEDISADEEGIVTITGSDTKTKGLIIGRNAQNLRNLEANVRRYFDVKEIKVV
ncbi:NusA-like transcription termination signal-binding factor [Candidatus Woesearchaeota archaeon]|nr:NusA-like transcription termination signal-binding factor [Candidatus Woesearchaeota archaeon]